MQLVGPAAQRLQAFARFPDVSCLVYQRSAEIEGGVCTDHQARDLAGDADSFQLGQGVGDLMGAGAGGDEAGFGRILVDPRSAGLEGYASVGQESSS